MTDETIKTLEQANVALSMTSYGVMHVIKRNMKQ
jgi:hypothetical protein